MNDSTMQTAFDQALAAACECYDMNMQQLAQQRLQGAADRAWAAYLNSGDVRELNAAYVATRVHAQHERNTRIARELEVI